jgi:predicted Zn-dependent protease
MRGPSAALLIVTAAVQLTACDTPGTPLRLAPYEFRLAGTDSVFHWPPSSLPVRYYVEPVGQLPEYVASGIVTWQQQFLYGEFRGERVLDSALADVVIQLIGSPPPDAPLTNDPPRIVCEGVTLVPPRVDAGLAKPQFESRLQIELRWFSGPEPSDIVNCLARVTTHEIGHSLGIFAHSADPVDLMFGQPQVSTPSLRDRATVQTLYHVPSDILPWSSTPP